ncbi:DUF1302 domain-containing protein [Zestomonas carbonaria]|uniref:DUF1302 domain-containing protein n=1 Tax=Zestomonas carbonaria TaxID=2762745 RepID=A0A7U7ENR2_9GAMM|nr:DUF1302 domain-containing protein [Pseudomonas carbonaria]CAD5107435.1 hypothetical protein PSEWESI4_01708 [Pseudomonas carbonaria]
MTNNNKSPVILRRCLLASAVAAALGAPVVPAMEIDTGSPDWAVRFDNTVKYNYGVRTESADKRMLGTPNSNDGDYNFRRSGTNITNRIDLLTELDVVYRNSMGFRVSAASWYDKAYDNTGSNSNPFVNGNDAASGMVGEHPLVGAFTNRDGLGNGNPHLSRYAKRYYSGPSGEILDSFLFYSTEIGEESLLSIKAGQHNVFWGETLLNPVHSVSYGQSGLDLAKLAASPGTEAKELFVPREQISVSFTVNPELTLAAQYFFSWDAARLPEAGTYYGGSDLVGEGAQSFLLGHTATPPGFLGQDALTNVRRSDDYTPDDRGDWGLMAKWSPEWLDGTLGAYYRRTSDILPQAVLDARSLSLTQGGCVVAPGGVVNPQGTGVCRLVESLAGTSYSFAYGDQVDIYGLSLSKEFGGVSVGSDLNFRRNMPLASIPALLSATGPGGLAAGLGVLPARSAGSGVVTDLPRDGDSMSATGDTLHWTINGLMAIADTPFFDSASLLGELYYSNLISLDSKNEALYKGKGTYRGIDKPTRDNWGLAVNFTPTWYQVLPGLDLSAPMSINLGLDGVSPVVAGGAEDTGNYSVGLSAAIYNKYFVDLKYVDSFGDAQKCDDGATDGATPNALDATERYTCYAGGYSSFSGGGATTEDRGAVYLTFKTTF